MLSLFSDEDANDWRPLAQKGIVALLGILWSILFLVVGWIATSTTTELARMREQLVSSQQEIAVLKTQYQYTRDQLDRIETAVNEIRNQRTVRR